MTPRGRQAGKERDRERERERETKTTKDRERGELRCAYLHPAHLSSHPGLARFQLSFISLVDSSL